jgi:hypothetical protein
VSGGSNQSDAMHVIQPVEDASPIPSYLQKSAL